MLEAARLRPRWWGRFAVCFALTFGCLVAWSLVTPMYGTADEQVHMVTAYAVTHGDQGRTNADGEREFEVPAVYTGETICYAFNKEAPASCLYFDSDAPHHLATSGAWAYPPFYYLLVGWPTLLSSGLVGLYLMRVVAAFWAAALLAVALQNLELVRHRGPLLLGVAMALTPAVFSLGGTVNPSGLSFAAALAVWTGGIVLLRTDRLDRPAHSLARLGAPLCLFLLLRRDTVLWAGLIGLLLIGITPRSRWRELARMRATWAWAGAVLASAALELSLSGGSTATALATRGAGSFAKAWTDMQFYLDQVGGGILGWFDARLPEAAYDVFTYGPALLAVVAICVAPRRIALAAAGAIALVLVLPLAIGTVTFGYFQGRYLLPLAFGVPLLGALGIAERLRGRVAPPGLAIGALTIVGVTQVASFAHVMRRFTAGAHGPWWFESPPQWTPPVLPPTILLIGYAAALTGLLLWIYGHMADHPVLGERRGHHQRDLPLAAAETRA